MAKLCTCRNLWANTHEILCEVISLFTAWPVTYSLVRRLPVVIFCCQVDDDEDLAEEGEGYEDEDSE
jgi:hypothetical protein